MLFFYSCSLVISECEIEMLPYVTTDSNKNQQNIFPVTACERPFHNTLILGKMVKRLK